MNLGADAAILKASQGLGEDLQRRMAPMSAG